METWTFKFVENRFGPGLAAVLFPDGAIDQWDVWSSEDRVDVYRVACPHTPHWQAMRALLLQTTQQPEDILALLQALPSGDTMRGVLIERLVAYVRAWQETGGAPYNICIGIAEAEPEESILQECLHWLFDRRSEASPKEWESALCLMPDASSMQRTMMRQAPSDVDWLAVFMRAHGRKPTLERMAWKGVCATARRRADEGSPIAIQLWMRAWDVTRNMGDRRRSSRAVSGLRSCRAKFSEWSKLATDFERLGGSPVADVVLEQLVATADCSQLDPVLDVFYDLHFFSREAVRRAVVALIARDDISLRHLGCLMVHLIDDAVDRSLLDAVAERLISNPGTVEECLQFMPDMYLEELEQAHSLDVSVLKGIVAHMAMQALTPEQAARVHAFAVHLGMRTSQMRLIELMQPALSGVQETSS